MRVAIINLTFFAKEIEDEARDVGKQEKYSQTYKDGIYEGFRLAEIIIRESLLASPPLISEIKKGATD